MTGMFLVDTNVLSEPAKLSPSPNVLNWLRRHGPSEVYTTVISQAEILFGVELLPAGKLRDALAASTEKMFTEDYGGRILQFDEDAARLFAQVAAQRQAIGRPISQFDAMIAAIARVHNATLVTRDVADFLDCGIHVVNPWEKALG